MGAYRAEREGFDVLLMRLLCEQDLVVEKNVCHSQLFFLILNLNYINPILIIRISIFRNCN